MKTLDKILLTALASFVIVSLAFPDSIVGEVFQNLLINGGEL
jgi:hypothetical protein